MRAPVSSEQLIGPKMSAALRRLFALMPALVSNMCGLKLRDEPPRCVAGGVTCAGRYSKQRPEERASHRKLL